MCNICSTNNTHFFFNNNFSVSSAIKELFTKTDSPAPTHAIVSISFGQLSLNNDAL